MNVHVPPPTEASAALDDTTRRQGRAADPAASAWVSANAGAGKTHVLSLRVVRLLLAGVGPSRILCLTYTKAAAAQMTTRVHRQLAAWATMDDAALAGALFEVMGSWPEEKTRERARRLFAHALDTPGGLKIQTIHAFCESILHRFPLEANVSGRFRMVDDAERAVLLAELRARMLEERAPGLAHVIERGQETALDRLLDAVGSSRGALDRMLNAHGSAEAACAALRARMGLADGDTTESVLAAGWPVEGFGPELIVEARDTAAAHPSTTHDKLVPLIDEMLAAAPRRRHECLCELVLTAKHEPRVKVGADGARKLSSSFGKPIQTALPWLLDAMEAAAVHALAVADRLHALASVEATGHALAVSERLRADWRALKHRRGLLDFDDLVARTADLLERGGGATWVHYKLDQGIDHVLLDEAQDTSRDQWRVIRKLTDEFPGDPDRPRTLFAVGDEKQSIYSFQGAAPEGFATQRRAIGRLHRETGRPFREERLDLSFRSTAEVLRAVDAVFAGEKARKGLGEDALSHVARRTAPGRVEVWPLLRREKSAEYRADWRRPVDATGDFDPKGVLAARVAGTIAEWLERGERLEGRAKALRPGDVMVLVRKRDAFVRALTRELKVRGVPVAGEDRLELTAHIAAQDLMAVGAVTLNPHDDLALAAALKSPLLGLTEDDLFELAHDRGSGVSLYRTLRRRGGENERWRAASERVAEWRGRVDTEPPYEFYARLLGPDGGRRAFLARLGPEASDVLDEFLGAALADREAALPGMEAFLASLRDSTPTVKRELDERAGEVRVMTVHAAKGLEAPVVFLVDCGSAPVSDQHLDLLVPIAAAEEADAEGGWEAAEGDPVVWRAPGLGKPPALKDALDRLKASREEEYRRLLYVGMTRAEDRLIVCGYGAEEPPAGIWHALCHDALVKGAVCRPVARLMPDGEEVEVHVLAREAGGRIEAEPDEDASAADEPSVGTPPHWLRRHAVREADLPRPLAPSGATALIEGEVPGAPARAGPLLGAALREARRPRDDGDLAAMKRGTVIHRLLQVLPSLPPEEREAAAARYVGRVCADLPGEWCERVSESALGVLRDPALAELFEGEARAEVPVMGTLEVAGAPRAVSGVIDRLILVPGRALLVDYKTGRNPPATTRAVPLVHVAQMALYRALVAPLFPDRAIDCALVYTEAPVRHDLAHARMDAVLARVLAGEKVEDGVEDDGDAR